MKKQCLNYIPDGSNIIGTEETTFDRSYVKKKLEHGLSRIWQVCFECRKKIVFLDSFSM